MDNLNSVLTNPSKISWQAAGVVSLNVPTQWKNIVFKNFWEIFSQPNRSSVQVECSYDHPVKKFRQKNEKCPLKLINWQNFYISLSKNLLFFKVFCCILRMQFWQTLRKIFDKKPKLFLSMSWKDDYVPNIASWKCFFGHKECSFDKPFESYSTECQNNFEQCPKKIFSGIFGNFVQNLNCSSVREDSSFDNLVKVV